MPIYEFKCLKCEEFFEVLLTRIDEDREISCPKCKAGDFERVMSSTSYIMGANGGGSSVSSPKKEERKCSSGTCTTYEVPGMTR